MSNPTNPVLNLPQEFNAAAYFVDRHLREGRGSKIAIECGEQRVTYAQLQEQVNRLGNAMLGLDVRPEERVFLLLLDTPEFAYSFFGAIKIGAVAVPVNTLLRPDDYATCSMTAVPASPSCTRNCCRKFIAFPPIACVICSTSSWLAPLPAACTPSSTCCTRTPPI